MVLRLKGSRKDNSVQAITIFLTLEQVLTIHDDQIDRYGGNHGFRDLGLLQSSVYRPQATFGGEDLYPSLFEKAAALIHSLLLNHAFVDGNKRTAMTSGTVFLELNDYSLVVSQQEFYSTAYKIEEKKMNLEQIVAWLKKHSKKL